MTRLIVHIGLHKTGTTTFQRACAAHRKELAERGVLYPSEPALTLNTDQHQGLVAALRSASESEIETLASDLLRQAEGYHTVLLSSEEFSNLLALPATTDVPLNTVNALGRAFDAPRYVCAIREDSALLKSMVREKMEGVGLPFHGRRFVRDEVLEFYRRMLNLKALLGPRLDVLDYEAMADGVLANNMMTAILGFSLELENQHLHTSSAKDARHILSGVLRMIIFNVTKSQTPYSAEVNAMYSKVMGGISIDEAVGNDLVAQLDAWLADEIADVLPVKGHRLRNIFGIEQAGAADACGLEVGRR